jgi:hypothetical protein
MEATLEAIVSGELSPNIFPFYHIGVTLAANASEVEGEHRISLESPNIINGCQTITIANDFLKKLEKRGAEAEIERFKDVKVIAKVVVGTNSDELKEITNANNRQNPIENWQLFSNEPVHIEIEQALKDIGVFYERQRGRFEALMRSADVAKHYPRTNGTFVRVVDLAQIICLARESIAFAAKPSDVFANKEAHDRVFDRQVARNPRDIVFLFNVHKSLKRALNSYLKTPAQVNTTAPTIFKKQVIRAHVYSIGLLHYYQSRHRHDARAKYSSSLLKKASTVLVGEMETVFYQKVVTKVRRWYTEASNDMAVDISKKRTDAFFLELVNDLGVSDNGPKPFSASSIDWSEYDNA